MDSIILESFRCFGARQVARLAPLTLLVGENSTGKTSLLALIRALWDVAIGNRVPNFSEPPYDLGAFREIAHSGEMSQNRTTSFQAGFKARLGTYVATFAERNSVPHPYGRQFSYGRATIEVSENDSVTTVIRIRIANKERVYVHEWVKLTSDISLTPLLFSLATISYEKELKGITAGRLNLIQGDPLTEDDYDEMKRLQEAISTDIGGLESLMHSSPGTLRPMASSPVRSRPLRTYHPTGMLMHDTEGGYVPSYLASLYHMNKRSWGILKSALERFGSESGLFDEITIKAYEETGGGPFQILVRKQTSKQNDSWRNLVDVGYGISQVLPVVTELLFEGSPRISLLQQPEVHLHPSAQAALGSFFCSIVEPDIYGNLPDRQLIVETHSDYIIDRVRMDVRDKKTNLKPEDVSILFFERTGADVTIHSLRIDEQGNVLGAPPSYGRFFLEETNRSIGI